VARSISPSNLINRKRGITIVLIDNVGEGKLAVMPLFVAITKTWTSIKAKSAAEAVRAAVHEVVSTLQGVCADLAENEVAEPPVIYRSLISLGVSKRV
jgi:hypothetical protein